jgi:hypothetical protein
MAVKGNARSDIPSSPMHLSNIKSPNNTHRSLTDAVTFTGSLMIDLHSLVPNPSAQQAPQSLYTYSCCLALRTARRAATIADSHADRNMRTITSALDTIELVRLGNMAGWGRG